MQMRPTKLFELLSYISGSQKMLKNVFLFLVSKMLKNVNFRYVCFEC